MAEIITIACIITALAVLALLSVIDLKTRLLPNKHVGLFFILGIALHASTNFHFITILDMVLGIIAGGGLLLTVRHFANKAYKRDTLGLGDVKLLAAAGAWLGLEYIFLAISIGSLSGLLHGVIYGYSISKKSGTKINLSKLEIPAGPGFIIGIVIIGIIKFYDILDFLNL